MVASISGGAEALKAMNGAVVKALKPPIKEKALRKSLPLIYSEMLWDNKQSQYLYNRKLTTHGCSGLHRRKQQQGCW